MKNFCLMLFAGSMALGIGCKPAEKEPVASENFGSFEGDVVAAWDEGGRKMELKSEFSYIDPRGRRWNAPAGSVVDGASIPAAFWTFVGGPFEGRYRYASVVHDVGCEEMTSSWEEVHRMFYDACRCGGVDDSTAKLMYYAVYHFGPRWEPVGESLDVATEDSPADFNESQNMIDNSPKTLDASEDRLAKRRGGKRRMRRMRPAPPTPADVEQIVEFIQDENPNTTEIEQTTCDELCQRPHQHRTSESDSNDPAGSNVTELSQQEQRWAVRQVVRFLVDDPTTRLPAHFDVQHSGEEYLVDVTLYSHDHLGVATGYDNENFAVRLSDVGEVLQIIR